MDDRSHIQGAGNRWLLLIHQLPAKPAYFRVKIWRRLQALGAVAVKNAVYALPANEQTQEDFEWLLREISEGGGEAMLCEARLIEASQIGRYAPCLIARATRTTTPSPRRCGRSVPSLATSRRGRTKLS